jgi:hypothetical protein
VVLLLSRVYCKLILGASRTAAFDLCSVDVSEAVGQNVYVAAFNSVYPDGDRAPEGITSKDPNYDLLELLSVAKALNQGHTQVSALNSSELNVDMGVFVYICTFDSMLYEIVKMFNYDHAPLGKLIHFCVSFRMTGQAANPSDRMPATTSTR